MTEQCAAWRPIPVFRADEVPLRQLNLQTVQGIHSHNETGARLCGWKGR